MGVVLEWHKNRADKRWSADYASRLLANMNNHIFPSIAHLPVPLLKTKYFATLLKGIEEQRYQEVTSRTQQQICNIMHYTVQRRLVENNPTQYLENVPPSG
ncbi:phage integrase central domain-containing protein [Edwardsiella tarda]